MNSLKNIILCIAVLATAGCAMEYSKDFDKAESLMQDYPKDALALLDSIKQYPIKSKAANARFALLYSQALDKNYIDVTDDSLISIAENWYSKKGSVREKFLSHYHKGVVNKNAKNYPEAIAAFSRAQKLEKEMDDYYLLGLLYNQMGYIFEQHYDYSKSIDKYYKSYDFYLRAGKRNHANYTLLDVASAYWNMAENTNDTIYNKSEFYYRKALEAGESTNYNILVKIASQNLFIQYLQRGLYENAEQIKKQYNVNANRENIVLILALSKYYFWRKDTSVGQDLLDFARKSCKKINDTAKLYEWEYSIFKLISDYKAALESLECSTEIQNKAVRMNLQQPIMEIQKELFRKELEYNEYARNAEKKIYLLTGLIFLLLLVYVMHLVRRKIKTKEEQLYTYLDIISEMQRTLKFLRSEITFKDAQIDSVSTNAYDVINNRIKMINNLSTILYEKQSSHRAKEIFMNEVKKIIEDFKTNADDLKLMEQVINGSRNNLLKKIYANYPTLSEDEKKLLCYVYAGFSPKAISVFLEISIETVYNRKSRLLAKTGLSKSKN